MFLFARIIYKRGISSRGERQPATLETRVRLPHAAPEGCGPATTESSNLSERGSTPRRPATRSRGHCIDGSTLLLQSRGPGSIPGGSTNQTFDRWACYRVGPEPGCKPGVMRLVRFDSSRAHHDDSRWGVG